ncbi:TRAP transporter small permease [Chloroflexota bacterium]
MNRSYLKKSLDGMCFIEKAIPAIGLALILIFIAFESILRYLFSLAILGLEELTVLIGLYTFFIGSAGATRTGVQIRVTIIDGIPLAIRIRLAIATFAEAAGVIICGFFTYYLVKYVYWTVQANVTLEPFGWPRLILVMSALIGVALMGIHGIERFVGFLCHKIKPPNTSTP